MLGRLGALVAVAALTGCRDAASPNTAPARGISPSPQRAVTTTVVLMSQPTLQKVGEPFTFDDLRMTMLSVEDPFPPTAQVRPTSGNRLVSIRYELVSQSAARNVSDLPAVELRDSTGATYGSEHGRLSVVGGSRNPGELPAGKSMETNAVFEVPGSATGLRVAFRSLGAPAGGEAVVVLN